MDERLPCVRLSSAELTPELAFRHWQAVLPQYSIRLPEDRDIADFRIEAAAWLLDPLVVMAGRTTTAWVDRLPKEGGGDETNLVFVVFVEGRWAGDADGRPFDFGNGELIALDVSRPSTGLATDSLWVMINVPRRALPKLARPIPDLHGHVFRSASAGFLTDHMVSLSRHLPNMRSAEAERIRRASLCLISAAIEELSAGAGSNEATEPSAVRAVTERHILKNLSSPDLTPAGIARDLEISRSTLYRAFAPFGGIAAYILDRRLEAARAILFHPEDHRSIREIADILGFSSTATFSKAFNRRFGCSPREARLTGSTRFPVSGRTLFRRWEDVLTASEAARKSPPDRT